MKMSVLYHSKSGHTREMAETIARGMQSVEGAEAKAFPIDALDEGWVKQSACIVLGSPIYMASISAEMKLWLETGLPKLGLAGKIGGAFATADYVHGGGELGIHTLLDHLMVYGLLAYSGGGSFGKPVIHLGPVAIAGQLDEYKETFEIYGQRMAQKTMEIMG